jgi:hypothetical protein
MSRTLWLCPSRPRFPIGSCAISYWIMTHVLISIPDRSADLLGGMWAAGGNCVRISVDTYQCLVGGSCPPDRHSRQLRVVPTLPVISAVHHCGHGGVDRTSDVGNDAAGSSKRHRHNRNCDGSVMVVPAINPQDAWHQPFLRPADTIVGVGIGLACNGFIRTSVFATTW